VRGGMGVEGYSKAAWCLVDWVFTSAKAGSVPTQVLVNVRRYSR